MDSLWSPIKEAGSLADRIVARIEELIVAEQLQPGDRLPAEREMARLLGVSRPALREAVKTLEAHGRVVVKHGQGVFVGEGEGDTIRSRLAHLEVSLAELFAMRQVLEVPAAAWAAANATTEEIDSLRAAFEAEEEARREPIDFDRLGRLDAAFHLRIVEMAKNRFLLQTLGILQEMLASGMDTTLAIPGRVEQSRHDHRVLFEAIRSRDPEAARAAAAAHILGAREAALTRVREHAEALDSEG
ncbi:MAG: FadR/GntR family transcriptional regulator [Acidimicrobiales bacterium]